MPTLKTCPFAYKRINMETGKLHASIDNPFSDDKATKKYCNYGKGPWCVQCQTYNQWKVSNEKWLKIYNRIGKEGKAPFLWKKPNPARIVNPWQIPLRKL